MAQQPIRPAPTREQIEQAMKKVDKNKADRIEKMRKAGAEPPQKPVRP